MLLQRIIDETTWQIGKLQSIREKLLSAQKEVDELEAYSAGKIGIDGKKTMLAKFEEGEAIIAKLDAAIDKNKKGGSVVPPLLIFKKSRKKGKRGRPAKFTDAEKLKKKRKYQRKYMRRRAAEKKAAKVEPEKEGKTGKKRGRPAKKKAINLPMSKGRRKQLLKDVYYSRSGRLIESDNDRGNPEDLGLGIGGDENED